VDVASGQREQVLIPRQRRGFGDSGGGWRRANEAGASGGQGTVGDVGTGIQPDMTDLVKSFWQNVLDKSSKKLDGMDGCGLAVFGSECDGRVGKLDKSAVADSHTVRVSPQVAQNMFDLTEWFLGIDQPIDSGQALHEAIEALRVAQELGALEDAVSVQRSQLVHHLAA
jgi:hypothetical protein